MCRRRRATASLGLDGALSIEGATTELISLMEQAGPYGAGNPEPRFALPNVRLVQASIVGEKPCALHPDRIGGARAG